MAIQVLRYTGYDQLKKSNYFADFQQYIGQAPHANFFQSPEFLQFIEPVRGYKPFILLAVSAGPGKVCGSLLGVVQSDGGAVKSWFSRRLIVWGGPILATTADTGAVVKILLQEMKKHARGNAIFIEFRNFFDCAELQKVFESCGFRFLPHLNYLVKIDEASAVKGRLSTNRKRQIKSSLATGAVITAPESDADIKAFYQLLKELYAEKVKKPLPGIDLFMQFCKSPFAKTFLVKYEGKVVGGSAGPIYRGQVLYQWYVCGSNTAIQGLYPSVLATWAPIEYGLKHGYQKFDFMGAGRPGEEYGVREFKARFGGEEVCYGRFEMVLNQSLYRVGKLGLKVYQTIRP